MAEVKRSSGSVVDLFCGVGGLSYGFKQAGFDIAAGVDIEEACRFAYSSNSEAPFLRRSVSDLSAKDLDQLFFAGAPKILIGCAPCQPFSTYNQKNEDPKWKLLDTFGDLIVESKPDIVSMENVPRLLQFRGGAVFESFVDKLDSAGYHLSWGVLYGPDFGLAQTRSRLVLLGSLRGEIKLPEPTTNFEPPTVRDVIGSLEPLGAGESSPKDRMHQSSRLSDVNLRRIRASKPGGTWRDWPEDLVASCHKVETGRGYSSVYGRMSWDEPSPTITTQFYGFGNGRFGHPEQDRALSLREGAMLQGFPRDYQFVAPGQKVHFKQIGKLIGNAVPVVLANAVAMAVSEHLETHYEYA